jgi:hypothetical protein
MMQTIGFFLFILSIILFVVKKRFFDSAHLDKDVSLSTFQVLEVQMPKNDAKFDDITFSSQSAELMFASLHGLLMEDENIQEHISFEITADKSNGILFYITVPITFLRYVESQIYAQHPKAKVKVLQSLPNKDFLSLPYSYSRLSFLKDNFFPIKTYKDFDSDSLSSITSVLSSLKEDEYVWVQSLIRPVSDTWQKDGNNYINAIKNGEEVAKKSLSLSIATIIGGIYKGILFIASEMLSALSGSEATRDSASSSGSVTLTSAQTVELKAIENKLGKMGFEVCYRICAFSSSEPNSMSLLRSITATFKQFSFSNLNELKASYFPGDEDFKVDLINRTFRTNNSFVLNTEELASLCHFPASSLDAPNISWVYSKSSEPPANIPTENCTHLGRTVYRDREIKFGLKNDDDRLRHMYLIGKTGTGKSTLFETMISQDIYNGYGVGVIDPHGELVEKVLDYIPDDRIKDVILIDPSDVDRPIGINLLELDDPDQKNLMASALLSSIKQHFDYSWGPRLEYLLNYCILTLLEVQGTTILSITKLFEDKNYRNFILHQVKDPVVLKFWNEEFVNMASNARLVTEAVAPIQNKINRFLSSTTIRNILCQKKSTVSFWDAMNDGKIILMNLSKGKIGKDNANLLGALLVSRIQFMALRRAKLSPNERRPFYLYVDEFQNFASDTFEEILSESRKYGLGLYLTHQFTAQLPDDLLKAVFGNIGTIATFGLGAPDAKVLENEFSPYFDQQDILSLQRFHIYIKLMIDGATSLPFSAEILKPWIDDMGIVQKTNNKEKAIEYSKNTYGVDRRYVEEVISRWTARQFDKGLAISLEEE